MSLILDALNRADKERSEQQRSPSLHAAPLPSTATTAPLGRWLLEGLLLAAALGAVLYVYYFRAADEAVVSTGALAVGRSPLALPSAASQPSLQQEVVTEPAPVDTTPRPEHKNSNASADSSNPAIANLYRQQQPPAVTPEAQTPSPAAPARPESVPQQKESGRTILQQIPLLATMPTRFQRSVPSIEYGVHIYNEEEGSGIVNLNGAMCRIGTQVAPGLRVIAILPDSVVMDYNGTHFRLLALNSWINF